MSGNNGTPAAQHAGPVHSSGHGGVTVSPLYRGAATALACEPKMKSASISHVRCHRQVCHILYKAYTKLGKKGNIKEAIIELHTQTAGWMGSPFFNFL